MLFARLIYKHMVLVKARLDQDVTTSFQKFKVSSIILCSSAKVAQVAHNRLCVTRLWYVCRTRAKNMCRRRGVRWHCVRKTCTNNSPAISRRLTLLWSVWQANYWFIIFNLLKETMFEAKINRIITNTRICSLIGILYDCFY